MCLACRVFQEQLGYTIVELTMAYYVQDVISVMQVGEEIIDCWLSLAVQTFVAAEGRDGNRS
jgi:hypothetical protein